MNDILSPVWMAPAYKLHGSRYRAKGEYAGKSGMDSFGADHDGSFREVMN